MHDVLGYEVRRARGRTAALRTLRDWIPDVVITSIRKSCAVARDRYLKVYRVAHVRVLLVCMTQEQCREIETAAVALTII